MRMPPIEVALTYPTPNYDNPTTRGNGLLIVNWTLICITIIFVGLRFYSRIVVKQWYGIDDSMIAIALLFTIGMTAVVLLANQEYGWDRHIYDVPISMIQNAGIIAFVAKIAFTCAATATRMSLICFYYRLVKDTGITWFRKVLHTSMVWVVAVFVTFVALTIFQCSPVRYYWTYPQLDHGGCLPEGQVTLAAGIINCVSDLLVTVLPIPIIWKLQMPIKQRIGVCCLLCLGFIVTIAGIVRTVYIWKSLVDSYDVTWYAYPLWIAAAVEIDLAVMCACAPAIKTLIHRPLSRFSTKVSSKLSSLRSRNSNARSQADTRGDNPDPKPAVFNPLRSLPWFQHERFAFQRTAHRSSEHYLPMQDLEEGLAKYGRSTVDIKGGGPSRVVHDPDSREYYRTVEIEVVSETSAAERPDVRDKDRNRDRDRDMDKGWWVKGADDDEARLQPRL